MDSIQLRGALKELHGDRDVELFFTGTGTPGSHLGSVCLVRGAMLIPEEPDGLVKVTDGKSVFILDAERVAWLRIG